MSMWGSALINLGLGVGDQMIEDRTASADIPKIQTIVSVSTLAVGGLTKWLGKRNRLLQTTGGALVDGGSLMLGQVAGGLLDSKVLGVKDPTLRPSQFDANFVDPAAGLGAYAAAQVPPIPESITGVPMLPSGVSVSGVNEDGLGQNVMVDYGDPYASINME